MDLWDFLGCSFCFFRTFAGLFFSLGLWFWCVIVFLLFFPLSIRFGRLKSAEPWGYLWFLFFFSFLDIIDIEH